MKFEPALHQIGQHAHGVDYFGISQIVGGQVARRNCHAAGFGERFFRDHFVHERQNDQHRSSAQCEHSQSGAEQKNNQKINREPWRIEKCEQAVAGHELPDGGEVLQSLAGVAAGFFQVLFKRSGVYPLVQLHVELSSDPDEHKAPHELQRAGEHECTQNHQRQHQQGCDVLAGEHPVIHLQHVQRGHQQHHVDDGAEDAYRAKSALEIS